MYDAASLEKKKLIELEAIVKENKITVPAKAKKKDIIKLILEHSKVSETIVQKKKQLSGINESSQSASNIVQKKTEPKGDQSFNNTPDIPNHYGRDKIVFLVRDPFWGYVYWELSSSFSNHSELHSTDKYLRVYDISDTNNPDSASGYFDIKLNEEANSWYIKFPQPNKTFVVDLGYFKDGKFITVLRSNKESTPRDDVSDQIDIEWMTNDSDFNKLLQASGVDKLFERVGSQEIVKFITNNLNEENSMFSGNIGLSVPTNKLNLSSMSSSSLSSGSGSM